MIRTHHQQPTLWTGFLKEEVNDLWEPWMRHADQVLDDEQLIDQVLEAQGRRWKNSRTRGRLQTPSEVVLRLLVLKHVRDWSYQTLEREVRANLVYRAFSRIGGEKVPDAKTMGRLGQAIGGGVVAQLHRRVVELAVEKKVVQGRKMRVDTTVVENQHPLSDRQQLAGRRSARADADRQAGGRCGGRIENQSARPYADGAQASGRVGDRGAAQGRSGRGATQGTV